VFYANAAEVKKGVCILTKIVKKIQIGADDKI
jgi:hypothetical protein